MSDAVQIVFKIMSLGVVIMSLGVVLMILTDDPEHKLGAKLFKFGIISMIISILIGLIVLVWVWV